MKFTDIIKEWLRENMLLLKDPDRFRSITTIRVVSIIFIAVAAITIYKVASGVIAFDISFVLGIFAIFISWLFFWSTERNSVTQMRELRELLRDFRVASEDRLEKIQNRLESVYNVSASDEPAKKAAEGEITDDVARALADVMNVPAKQILIALAKHGEPINDSTSIAYSFKYENMNFSGSTSLDILRQDLAKAALIDYDNKTKIVSLTEKGKKFVKWLIDNGQKALYFRSPQLAEW